METLVNYLIESGISLALLALVYYFFLRKETFFLQNRIFLVLSVIFSIVLPLLRWRIHKPQTMMLPELIVKPQEGFFRLLNSYGQDFSLELGKSISSVKIIAWIYLVGVVISLVLFLTKCINIYRLKKRSKLQKFSNFTIATTQQNIAPFSFMHTVFIPKNLTEKEEKIQPILAHEMVHVKQRHFYDIFILQLLLIVQWFNPFAWLLNRALHENHEFIADREILKTGINRGFYKSLLLNQCLGKTMLIGSPFNYSLIKNRVKMMNKSQSHKFKILKYIFGVFTAIGLIIAFGMEEKVTAVQFTEVTNKATHQNLPQEPNNQNDNEKIFVIVEQMPTYPDGIKNMLKDLGRIIIYPKEAAEKKIEGRVYLKFVVQKDGTIDHKNIIVMRSPSPLLSQAAIEAVKKLKPFQAGKQRGKPVKVWYQLPISFLLEKNGTTVTPEE